MLVDDSAVVRSMIQKALQASDAIEVVATAANGLLAIDTLKKHPADVILLDVEMPEMDGLTALPKLLVTHPDCKIIIVSSHTRLAADFTVRALELGATDCIAKPSSQDDKDEVEHFFKQLREKIILLGGKGSAASRKADAAPALRPSIASYHIRCLAIGASTGGPKALMEIFQTLKGMAVRIPIFITQHMPATFTQILAKHINDAADIPCQEAKEGQEVKPGHIYIAPGDYHLVPKRRDGKVLIHLSQSPPVNYCRPAVDPMFEALADIYGANLMALVLTGMGNDGFKGAQKIKAKNGRLFIQNRESCVVWGMPKAISDAGIADAEVPLSDMAGLIREALR